MFYRLMCRFYQCFRCRVYETPDGIGGKCIDCGKIHGWVTREELRAYAEREAMHAINFNPYRSK
jgi:hypothetical protein